jgi:hypothetical protein
VFSLPLFAQTVRVDTAPSAKTFAFLLRVGLLASERINLKATDKFI